MLSLSIVILMTLAGLCIGLLVAALLYVMVRYSPIVARIFEEKPMFLPLRVPRTHDGEDVRFPTLPKPNARGNLSEVADQDSYRSLGFLPRISEQSLVSFALS